MFKYVALYIALLSTIWGGEEVRIVPMERSPEPATTATTIIFPRPEEKIATAPVNVQLRISGFPLGVMTQNERAEELRKNGQGQAIEVVVDGNYYLSFYESLEDSFNQDREYYDALLSFGIPSSVEPGAHTLRVFPVRSYGESLKEREAFAMRLFSFQQPLAPKEVRMEALQGPFLTYNQPRGVFSLAKDDPILLDFLLSECDLSPDGFTVRLSIDQKQVGLLTDYVPYYLYGLSEGNHEIQLELLNKKGEVVPGIYAKAAQNIQVNYTRE